MRSFSRTVLLICMAWPAVLPASLQVFPTRVALNEQKRVASVSVRHLSDQPGHYRVSAVFYRMAPNGSMEMVKDPRPEERSAVPLIRFTPRTTTIPPRREQVVQVMYIGPKNLPDGEYRAHLHFEPTNDDDDTPLASSSKKGAITMAVKARVALAIPVIYRRGNVRSDVALSDLKILNNPNGGQDFSVQMAAEGNAFPYGDFEAYFTPSGSSPQSVGLLRGVASYLKARTVLSQLTPPPGLKLRNGNLTLEFREPESGGKRGKLLAKTEVQLP